MNILIGKEAGCSWGGMEALKTYPQLYQGGQIGQLKAHLDGFAWTPTLYNILDLLTQTLEID